MSEDFARGWRWEHCSPSLLNEGISCGLQPRRACTCPVGGSHDHLVQRGWPDDPPGRTVQEIVAMQDVLADRFEAAEPAQEEMAQGHLFQIGVQSWGVSRVVGDPTYTQADWTLPPHPVGVRAWSLREALLKAADLPLRAWFPQEGDDD